MRKLFGRTAPEVPGRPERPESENLDEMKQVVQEQQVESAKTLDYVAQVLHRKDELLAEAINQTGSAVRRRRRRAAARLKNT